jgi:hypothetical protein
MSTDRDTTRIVRSWLEEGVTALPDRVLDAVLDQVPATPQRRSWWPARRFASVNTYAKVAIALAAVVVVAVVGYNLLPRSGVVGGLPTSPPPTASPAPSLAPMPSSGHLPAGTYLISNPALTIYPYSLTVPTGWDGGDGAHIGDSFAGTGVELTSWLITDVYADSCHWTGTLARVLTRPALVAALVAQTGHAHGAPVETTIGGKSATKLTLSLDAAADLSTCEVPGHLHVWPDPGPDESGGWAMIPGETLTVYVMDAPGRVMLLMTVQHKDSPPADVTALQHVLDSVVFQPAP